MPISKGLIQGALNLNVKDFEGLFCFTYLKAHQVPSAIGGAPYIHEYPSYPKRSTILHDSLE